MSMDKKKTILVCMLGKSPQVLVETAWALANQMHSALSFIFHPLQIFILRAFIRDSRF